MSRTISSGDVSGDEWRYTAQAMQECLAASLGRGEVRATDFPTRLLGAATEFLTLALSAVGQRTQGPPSTIANYRIAAQALREANPGRAEKREDVEQMLREHLAALDSLRSPHRLAAAETETLKAVRDFFRQVFSDSDVRAYRSVVSLDPSE